MPIDFYACVIALPSRMRVIHCCLLLPHALATSETPYHTEVANYMSTRSCWTTTDLLSYRLSP